MKEAFPPHHANLCCDVRLPSNASLDRNQTPFYMAKNVVFLCYTQGRKCQALQILLLYCSVAFESEVSSAESCCLEIGGKHFLIGMAPTTQLSRSGWCEAKITAQSAKGLELKHFHFILLRS